MLLRTLSLGLIGCALPLLDCCVQADTYEVTLDPAARSEPATGRIVLFFITNERLAKRSNPIEAPFFELPQPIVSIAVKDFKPGETVKINADAAPDAFPSWDALNQLSGKVHVQAVLDADQTERSHDAGPGNVYSDDMVVDLSAGKDDTIHIALTNRVEIEQRKEGTNLKWVTLRSEMLSKFYGRDVYHRAGVALPMHYNDPNWPRQQWPAIYVIPGFGGRDDVAVHYQSMLEAPKIDDIAPVGVFVVLDPESPLGHHGFVDSANNGPRATALVKEFIPYLEQTFRIVPAPEARIVTGHSSGGWASLWLQLNFPDVFGACWSSAPDPIDFSAFQMTDLYHDASMFTDADGRDVPSYRRYVDATFIPKPVMTVKQEVGMEQAIDPDGRCGQQWAAWNAAFSPRDEKTGLPVLMFDPKTGKIDQKVVESWSRFDISRMVKANWEKLGPVVLNKVHLACGAYDSYYLNRAVERFKTTIESLKADKTGEGYITLVPEATHDSLTSKIFIQWNDEMRAYLQKHGLQDK